MKELLLDKAAWDRNEIHLADAPTAPRDYTSAGFEAAYGGMVSYESALDAAGYRFEREMSAPGAKIWVTLCQVDPDGAIRTTKNGQALRASVDEIYAAHHQLAPQRIRDASQLATRAKQASGLRETFTHIQHAVREIGREVLISFDATEEKGFEADISFAGPGEIDWPESLAELKAEIEAIAPHLLRQEMSDFDTGAGATGRLRILGDEAPWLDADDRNADWVLERPVDLEGLEEDLESPSP